ncbi:multiple sugar transport system substrate-binding protein [Streptosporangium becharense]|uniref:Multiple sugar transport system substrate-binding protein n=1 Tax=Streptosporangium becharense TaxID=1816182 RepID=A0A7W9IBQ9_9ACTN|nr:ABC transporter substrate-binding protein [Streptosporangium becharense]MBB2913711.1 multiple sugar transport system substrate-binding protein [Streptosporangium becharense]MBB5817792.1 multiple sugar transport system substrate-binding protein [Streptosporangium becharense]
MHRRFISMALAVATATALTACTAGTQGAPALGSQPKPSGSGPAALPAGTIELWHGFSSPAEVKAFEDAVAGFRTKFPQITVKLVKGVQDEQITQAVRGGKAPDVASSFTTDNVAQWCNSGTFQDLTAVIKQDGIDLSVLPEVARSYTEFQGKRCAMPLLADAYGLYYNKKLMKGTTPPKTLSELTELAKKLTVRDADGDIEVAGFIPSFEYYENSASHFAPMTGATWYKPDGTSAIGTDPAWKELLRWQKELVDWYGYDKLNKFRKSLGQEWSADHPFYKGKVAMILDGEWRNAMIANEAKDLDYGTAPLPVADAKPELYGSGFTAGTVIGVPKGAKNPQAAWELVKYLTTDTSALVTLSNALRNVPTTKAALESPDLKKDANFQTFLDIFAHPKTSTVPASVNSAFNQDSLQEFLVKWEKGSVTDLDAGLADVDRRINDKLKLAGG